MSISMKNVPTNPPLPHVFELFCMTFILLFIRSFTALSITYAKSDMWDWDS